MADQQLNDRLDEILLISKRLITAVEDLRTEQKEHSGKFLKLENSIDGVQADLRILSGQFGDVANLVVKNDGRLAKVELDVAELKSNVH
jgi:hypothetical protein